MKPFHMKHIIDKMAKFKDIIWLKTNIMSFNAHIPHGYPQIVKFLV